MTETRDDKQARFHDECPRCHGTKSKGAKVCASCRKEIIDANRKSPKRERSRQGEYDSCPTCGGRKYQNRAQCLSCSFKRPLQACPEPGCRGRVHRKPPPIWLPEAAALVRQGQPAGRIARQLGADPGSVHYWLPHAGILPAVCEEEGCDAEIGPGSRFCLKHAAGHRQPPKPRCLPPANVAELVPVTADYDTLAEWLLAVCKALEVGLHSLSRWCELAGTVLPNLVRFPDRTLQVKTQQNLHRHLGASVEELERLRPSASRRSAAGKQAVKTRRERYGDEALSEWGRQGMKGLQESHTEEQLHEFQRIGAAAAAKKLCGKRRDPELIAHMRRLRWGAGRTRTRKKDEFRHAIRKRRPSGTGAHILRGRKAPGSTWAAKNRFALHQRRRKFPPEAYDLCRRLHGTTSLVDIARHTEQLIGEDVSVYFVRRMLGELGLRPMRPDLLTPEKAKEARKAAHPEQLEALERGRALGTPILRQVANERRASAAEAACQAALDALIREGRTLQQVTQTMLVNKSWELCAPESGVHPSTAKKFLARLRLLTDP